MSDYDTILLHRRHGELQRLAQRQHEWAEAREAMLRETGRAQRRGLRHLFGLRSRVRRGLKGRRALA